MVYSVKVISTAMIFAASALGAAAIDYGTAKADFEQRKELVGADRPCFDIFGQPLNSAQRDALEFLYAYMPLPDITDYDGSYYLKNVDASLRAKAEMPWGPTVPDREFRHFVLPPRVNNENLDSCRWIFYDELKGRVEGLSMADAILEVNHWCHEKVTYQPSDGRTSSPLATVCSAIGRCGEESTFTVAALRAVGIPARQIYTPRWAHTDDNHAWVEAWADGKWHFLGACEPEPTLDLGWFNAPAARGLMMNTKVFGSYDGPEEIIDVTPCYTVINVTSNYAPVADINVLVEDADGNAVADAEVRFSVYNYAEYYPMAIKRSDSGGRASLTAGHGDIIVWASHNGKFGLAKASVGTDATVKVVLDKTPAAAFVEEWNLVPPMQDAVLPEVSVEARTINDERKAREDSLRNAYTATFYTPEEAARWATAHGFDPVRVAPILVDSRGNREVIAGFLSSLPDSLKERGVRLLSVVAEKDRRDIAPHILADFIGTPETASPLHDQYVLNPRIATEGLTPYRSFFNSVLDPALRQTLRDDPQQLVRLVASRVAVDPAWNPQKLRMHPASVWTYGVADAASRNLMFVAAARTAGIPARIDPISGNTQYADAADQWHNVDFGESAGSDTPASGKGLLNLAFTPHRHLNDAGYYTHFTLTEIADGTPRLMEYPEDATAASTFASPQEIGAGQYMLTTGQRMADGTVLARSQVFTVGDGARVDLPLIVRSDTTGIEVIGSFNSESLYHDDATGADKSLLSTSGRGYYVLALVSPGDEPTNHVLRDIASKADALEKIGATIFVLSSTGADAVDPSLGLRMPHNVATGKDIDGAIASALEARQFPVVVIADTFNRVVFRSDGYIINLGDRLLDAFSKLNTH